MLSISVVSHRQATLVHSLLNDIAKHCLASSPQVILTINVPEPLPFSASDFPFQLTLIQNPVSRGFGANHNQACRRASGDIFCVVNPDIRLNSDPFPPLRDALKDPKTGAVAPKVLRPDGSSEIHARAFPSATTILRKALFGIRSDYIEVGEGACTVDWVAGMFMVFRTRLFRLIGGFDERYFLYYEDVDLCGRLRRAGYETRVEPMGSVVHDARHSSHRNPRYFLWHIRSMARYFLTQARNIPPL